MQSFGFPPVSSPSAQVLVLGSLPGRLSLDRGEYYANPHNAFWRIVAAQFPRLPADYAGRVAALVHHRIALWDVLAAATRSGSLDAAIEKDAIPNNFRAFLNIHPDIRLICFNGVTAAGLFQRHALQRLTDSQRAIGRITLPSTSAAHARASLTAKTDEWLAALRILIIEQ
jgi:TDG/mug DNA glycosylase family protein